MKTLFITSIITFVTTSVFAQGTEITKSDFPNIKFNFDNPKEITIPKKIKRGDFYQVVVEDINLNIYRVELQNSDTIYSTELDFPIFGSIDVSSLENIVGTFSNFGATAFQEIDVEPELLMDEMSKGLYNRFYEVSPSISSRMRDQLAKAASEAKKVDEIKKQLSTTQASIIGMTTPLTERAKEIDDLQFEFSKTRILSRQNPLPQDFSFKLDISSTLDRFQKIRVDVTDIKKKVYDPTLKGFNDFFEDPEVQKIIANPTYLELKIGKDKIEKAFKEAKDKLDKMQSMVTVANVEKSMVSILHLYKKDTYTSLPIQLNGEEAELTMRFIPKDSASNLQRFELSPIRFPQNQFYWSIGPILYTSWLSNDRVGYETTQVNDSTQNYRLLEESSLNKEMGVAAMLRTGIRHNGLGVHIAVGTGVSLGEEVRARILTGVGISIGKTHSLTIDIGAVTGYVDRISDSANFNKVYVDKPQTLVNELDSQFFVGIGYMFNL